MRLSTEDLRQKTHTKKRRGSDTGDLRISGLQVTCCRRVPIGTATQSRFTLPQYLLSFPNDARNFTSTAIRSEQIERMTIWKYDKEITSCRSLKNGHVKSCQIRRQSQAGKSAPSSCMELMPGPARWYPV